jgi:hypothetical protein
LSLVSGSHLTMPSSDDHGPPYSLMSPATGVFNVKESEEVEGKV